MSQEGVATSRAKAQDCDRADDDRGAASVLVLL
jgi:hypothetical protein